MSKRSREASPSPSSSDAQSSRVEPGRDSRASSTPAALSSPIGAEHSSKYAHLDEASKPKEKPSAVMHCQLPGHPSMTFNSIEEYEVHYQKSHVNRCSECRKNFPSNHFLSLHISENHDPFKEILRERGEKTYECFVEGCEKICSTPQKRRMHLVDKHHFPKVYDFFIVNDGIDNRSSMLRQPPRHCKHSTAADRAHQLNSQVIPDKGTDISKEPVASGPEGSANVEKAKQTYQHAESSIQSNAAPAAEDPMEGITQSMSALEFVPRSVRFGRGGRRSGFARQ